MSGLSNRRRTGIEAREALITSLEPLVPGLTIAIINKLIERLSSKGFAIVSTRCEPTARRGAVYTGPEFIGKSHSARIVG